VRWRTWHCDETIADGFNRARVVATTIARKLNRPDSRCSNAQGSATFQRTDIFCFCPFLFLTSKRRKHFLFLSSKRRRHFLFLSPKRRKHPDGLPRGRKPTIGAAQTYLPYRTFISLALWSHTCWAALGVSETVLRSGNALMSPLRRAYFAGVPRFKAGDRVKPLS
jgi:hypothetical protein